MTNYTKAVEFYLATARITEGRVAPEYLGQKQPETSALQAHELIKDPLVWISANTAEGARALGHHAVVFPFVKRTKDCLTIPSHREASLEIRINRKYTKIEAIRRGNYTHNQETLLATDPAQLLLYHTNRPVVFALRELYQLQVQFERRKERFMLK